MHSHLISCGQFGKISGRGIAQGWTGFRQILHHLAGCLSLNFRIASFQAAGKVTRFRIRFILSGPIGIFSKDGFLRGQCRCIPVRFQICRQIAQKFQKAGSALRNGSSGIAFPLQIQKPGKLHFGILGPVHTRTGILDGLHQRPVSLAVFPPMGIVAAVPGSFHNRNVRILEPSILLQSKGKPVFRPHA